MVNCDLAREAATVAFSSECVVMAVSYSDLKASQWGSFKSECAAYAWAVDLLPLIERKYGKQRGSLAAFARSVGVTTGQITNVIKGRRTISSSDAVAWAEALALEGRERQRFIDLAAIAHLPSESRPRFLKIYEDYHRLLDLRDQLDAEEGRPIQPRD